MLHPSQGTGQHHLTPRPLPPRLSKPQVNLSLLEGTGISRAVAQLRTHSNRHVAALADAIVRGWRSCAVAALQHATTALERHAQ